MRVKNTGEKANIVNMTILKAIIVTQSGICGRTHVVLNPKNPPTVPPQSKMVSKLFARMKTPFTKRVIDHPLPIKFKTPQIPSYSGIGDPIEHLENYQIHIALHATPDEIACRAFPTTLSSNAWEWFQSLMPNSIGTFEDLTCTFLTHFLGS